MWDVVRYGEVSFVEFCYALGDAEAESKVFFVVVAPGVEGLKYVWLILVAYSRACI